MLRQLHKLPAFVFGDSAFNKCGYCRTYYPQVDKTAYYTEQSAKKVVDVSQNRKLGYKSYHPSDYSDHQKYREKNRNMTKCLRHYTRNRLGNISGEIFHING